MPDASSPVLDQAVLAELKASTGDDPEFLRELVETYLADVPEQFEGMAAAISANDAEALVRPAHTLKSSSATVGAARLAAIARELEFAGRSGSLDETAASRLAAAREESRAASEALTAWLTAEAGA